MTACLAFINKNDSHHFPRMIKSFTGVVDKFVMVDTGSKDDSLSIADKLGCRVYEQEFPLIPGIDHKWNFNFGAAKQYALDMAEKENCVFTIIVDSDDELDFKSKGPLERLIKNPKARNTLFAFKVRNVNTLSLFTHTCMVESGNGKFQFPVHENLEAKNPRTKKMLHNDIVINHYGYSFDDKDEQAKVLLEKNQRNFWIMENVINAKPEPWPDHIKARMLLLSVPMTEGIENQYKKLWDAVELVRGKDEDAELDIAEAIIDKLLMIGNAPGAYQTIQQFNWSKTIGLMVKMGDICYRMIGVSEEAKKKIFADYSLKCWDDALKMENTVNGTYMRFKRLQAYAEDMTDMLKDETGREKMYDYALCWANIFESDKALLDYVFLWQYCLDDLGLDFKRRQLSEYRDLIPGPVNLIIGVQDWPWQDKYAIENYRIKAVQLEQLDKKSKWWKPVESWIENCDIIDYSSKNMDFLLQEGKKPKLCVPGYHKKMERIFYTEEKEIDVVFFGHVNARRKAIIDRIAEMGYRVFVSWDKSYFGAERDKILAKARIALNIHNWDEWQCMEVIRISYYLNNMICVISEEAEDNPYPFLKTVKPELIPETVKYYLDNEEERKNYTFKCYEEFKKIKMTDNVKAVL